MKQILCLIAPAFAGFTATWPGRRSISLKPFSMLAVVVALSFHLPIFGSSLQPKGAVTGGGTPGSGGPCPVGIVAGIVLGGTPGFGPVICFGGVRVGDIGVLCAPDSTASPCSGTAVELSGPNQAYQGVPVQTRVDLVATVSGAAGGATTSGTVRICSGDPNISIPTCSAIPFQTLGNGVISVSSAEMIILEVDVRIDIDSMPAGATLNIINFVVNPLPISSQTGAIQVCKTAGVGISPGTPFNFSVQQFTVTAPPVNQVITVPAGMGTESCSDNLLFPKGSFVVVHEATSGNETVIDVTGADILFIHSAVDILRGTAAAVVGDSPFKFTFTNKVLGTEGCGSGYYRNHPDSFPSLFPASEPDFMIPPISAGPGTTFLQALDGHGGSGLQGAIDLLTRSGITALLNAAHPDVAYALPMIGSMSPGLCMHGAARLTAEPASRSCSSLTDRPILR